MRLSIKIWLLAILYQTIFFTCMLYKSTGHQKLLLSILPIEFIGGLPGLVLFSVIVHYLIRSQNSIRRKWFYMILGTYLSAFFTNLMTSWFLCIPDFRVFIVWQHFVQPAPIAAVISLLTFAIPTHKLLKENLFQS